MVDVRVPAPLRVHTQGEKMVKGDGSTVGELLEDLDRRFPGIRTGLFDPSSGELRQFVNVYVNDEDIRYLGRLKAPLEPGDTVSILPAVAGGS
jgi:molybdopterin converting factor small subunit